jgi:hypothetical protein
MFKHMPCPSIKSIVHVSSKKHGYGLEGINPRFRELGPLNTLLIDDCPYMCLGNVPYSYILPHPFNSQKVDNYLMDTLWPYLLGLYEAPSCVKYVGFKPHG